MISRLRRTAVNRGSDISHINPSRRASLHQSAAAASLSSTTMLTRSWLAVVCGCVAAVVATRDDFRYAYQDAHQDRLEFSESNSDERPRWGPPPKERPFPPPGPPGEHHPPPGAPHHPPKFPDKTIYEALRDDDRCVRSSCRYTTQ